MSCSHSVVGVGVVVDRDDHVLLIKRGQAPRQGEWSIPGGRQELGETVRETAVREVMEETGVTIAHLRLVDVVDVVPPPEDRDGRTQWALVDFRADWVSSTPCAISPMGGSSTTASAGSAAASCRAPLRSRMASIATSSR